MASAEVTGRGIVVLFDADAVSVPGRPADQDDAAIEEQLTEAIAPLGITPAQLDAVTNAEPWAETKPGELAQLFAWKLGIDVTNWRARIS